RRANFSRVIYIRARDRHVGFADAALSKRLWSALIPPCRFAMVPPPAQPLSISGFDPDVAVSPDGSRIVYRAIDRTAITTADRLSHLVVRAIGELHARPLPDTAGARFPFVSPDGRWVGFFVGAELKRVPIGGGLPITVCRLDRNPRGGSWGPDDTIIFATDD